MCYVNTRLGMMNEDLDLKNHHKSIPVKHMLKVLGCLSTLREGWPSKANY